MAGLAEERRLLVAGDSGDGDFGAEHAFGGRAVHLGRGQDLRKHRARHAEELQKLLVPRAAVDVVELGARGIRGIGEMELARSELPREPAVDGAEKQLAFFRARLEARDIFKQPLELGRGEIRVDHEARLRADRFGEARLFQRLAALGGAPVLPDDGAVRGLPGAPVPHDHRFPLVRDADRGEARGGELCFPERRSRAGELRAEDLLGVVLDPAGPGKELAEFLLRRGARAPALVEHDGAGTRGSLVEREHVAHGKF